MLAPKMAGAQMTAALPSEQPSTAGVAPAATSAPAAVAAAAVIQQPEPARMAGQTTATETVKDPVAAKSGRGWSDAQGEADSSDGEDEEATGFEVVPQAASEDSDASSDDEDAKLNALDADGKAEVSAFGAESCHFGMLMATRAARCWMCT